MLVEATESGSAEYSGASSGSEAAPRPRSLALTAAPPPQEAAPPPVTVNRVTILTVSALLRASGGDRVARQSTRANTFVVLALLVFINFLSPFSFSLNVIRNHIALHNIVGLDD